MRIVAVIPAHLASVRFPRKVMYRFHGVPMIEHVRRRALSCQGLDEVYVATCDPEIADLVRGHGGQVVMTAATHSNGTSRVAEAIETIDCSHVVLLQADEPLLLPRHVERIIEDIRAHPEDDAWNVTGPIEHENELDRHSFVKCLVTVSQQIMFCCRRSPLHCEFELQRELVRKILGIIAYRSAVLPDLTRLPPAMVERAESIEQMRLIENGYGLRSVPVNESLPSVNEPHEVEFVEQHVASDPEQSALLARVLDFG